MFDTLRALLPRDADYPPRVGELDLLQRVLNGTLYDVLPYQFHEERGAGGDYIPIRQRRPSIRYALCRTVVEDSVALLFSEGHFPRILCDDQELRRFLSDLIQDCGLNAVMTDAALRGSVGSIVLLLRILKGRVYVSAIDSIFLTPIWQPDAPDALQCVTEQYKVPGRLLQAQGYDVADPGIDYWFRRVWDGESETWYQPWPVSLAPPGGPAIDESRSIHHRLGFVPLVWIRNLPGGDSTDGGCTFRAAIETSIEIDYQLSQAGRGLTYSSDPTLLIKEPATADREIIKGAGNALVVSKDGDAKLLEIGGTAANAVIDYVRVLRELALESVHGNRSSADRIAAAQSGRALELMNQGLIWLADNLRISYGTNGILPLLRMILRAADRYPISVLGRQAPKASADARLMLDWPRWYPPSAADQLAEAQTLSTLAASGQISRETAVRSIADAYGVTDVAAELDRIAKDKTHDDS
ncbi:phage portal protein [Acidisoma cellulosilytica]|uniref:Phage portal protein n=1 Tax=Acidisoma cellulosilyticum TaxID=2802395 RepID=A0A963Z212_9PROT|nr:phage portal protein [Acidisoma cellulosilyticum]MCB8880403.1 phage portal protein [Acidisoma cellulosilyticum]